MFKIKINSKKHKYEHLLFKRKYHEHYFRTLNFDLDKNSYINTMLTQNPSGFHEDGLLSLCILRDEEIDKMLNRNWEIVKE
jgi:hypothetical protein